MRAYRIFLSLALCHVIVAAGVIGAGAAVADIVVHVRDKDGTIISSTAVPPGGWVEAVEKGGATPTPPNPNPPNPNPNPPPNPPPAPPPAPPNAGKAVHFIMVRDDTPGRMNSAQLAALANQSLRQSVSARGLKWWTYDVSQDEVQKTPAQSKSGLGLATAMQKNNVQAPCFIWMDAKGVVTKVLAMPQDSAGITAAVTGG